MVDYGTDIRIGTVVSTQSGIKNLIEAILWRLQTPRGSLFYDTSYGEDVREYLQSELTPATLHEMQGLIKSQCYRKKKEEGATDRNSWPFLSCILPSVSQPRLAGNP